LTLKQAFKVLSDVRIGLNVLTLLSLSSLHWSKTHKDSGTSTHTHTEIKKSLDEREGTDSE